KKALFTASMMTSLLMPLSRLNCSISRFNPLNIPMLLNGEQETKKAGLRPTLRAQYRHHAPICKGKNIDIKFQGLRHSGHLFFRRIVMRRALFLMFAVAVTGLLAFSGCAKKKG